MIYMDAAATAPAHQQVLDTISPLLTHDFGNPSSRHELGRNAERAVSWARNTVANELGVGEHEIYFTSGGTEADNLAVIGAALAAPRERKIITSAIEHPAVQDAAAFLAEHHGFTHELIPVDHEGVVDLAAAERLIDAKTAVVSVMAVNNEVGTIQPIAQLGRLARAAGAFMHTDAVQAAGWLDLSDLTPHVDALSISGHKIGALKAPGCSTTLPTTRSCRCCTAVASSAGCVRGPKTRPARRDRPAANRARTTRGRGRGGLRPLPD
ncbi:aminotransferase class V-fold PLP-dependent enzyme [Arthrobacter sp. JCM 19049]|uniref:cysteine desulfurase family protein n=1 Tax=Arthrobacter sp. JCM 19049 TaxID=1460643 RepID=UPI000A59E606|nr:aminotransferase class V-fold PLP-dependent enzyme [Arthrobacter sp. JCM 19049]